MYSIVPVAGAAIAAAMMLALAWKWKLPRTVAWTGIAVIAVVCAVPFFWIHPSAETTAGAAVVVAGQVACSLAVAGGVLMQRFWRDPERTPPETEGVVLSAADGEIDYVWHLSAGSDVVVRKAGRDFRLDELAGTEFSGAVHVIGVGMSFLDVHVNRCPIPGTVVLSKHISGPFLSLGLEEAQFVNERFTTVIHNDDIDVAVVQIASRLVRRIVSYLTVGEPVEAGQRLGMIRLGSLVAHVIPARDDVHIEVEPGMRATAGVTVLARYGGSRPGG